MRISSELPKGLSDVPKVSKGSMDISTLDPELPETSRGNSRQSIPMNRLPSISPVILALLEKELFAFGKLQMAYQRSKAYERGPIQKKMELQFQEMLNIVESNSIQENSFQGTTMMPWQEEMKQLHSMLFHGINTKTESRARLPEEASWPDYQRMSHFFTSFQRQDRLSVKGKYVLLLILLGILILLLLW